MHKKNIQLFALSYFVAIISLIGLPKVFFKQLLNITVFHVQRLPKTCPVDCSANWKLIKYHQHTVEIRTRGRGAQVVMG